MEDLISWGKVLLKTATGQMFTSYDIIGIVVPSNDIILSVNEVESNIEPSSWEQTEIMTLDGATMLFHPKSTTKQAIEKYTDRLNRRLSKKSEKSIVQNEQPKEEPKGRKIELD